MSFDEIFERFRKRMKELFEELREEIERETPMWTPDGALEPLVSLYEYPNKYEIIIDLPYADLNALSITIKKGVLIIECQLRREIRFERWGAYREIGFRRYSTTIKLPEDADTENMVVEKDVERRIIRIHLPKKTI